MKKAILLLSLIGLASSATAADWVLIVHSPSDGISFYIDRDSLRYDRTQDTVTVWAKKAWSSQGGRLGKIELTYLDQVVDQMITKDQYYCSQRKGRATKIIYYNQTGGLIGSFDLSTSEAEDVSPDSIGETLLEAVCTNPPQVISRYEQPEDATQAAYDSAVASVFAANVAAFLARPENQIFKEGSPEYNVLNDQVIYLQTNQPYLESGVLLEKARKATAALIDIPPVPEKRSVPRATPRPAVKPIPQRQRTPESRPIVNRL